MCRDNAWRGGFAVPTFGLLGPLLVRVDGQEVELASVRRRAMLAALLLADGKALTPDELLGAGWGEAPPPSGAATLRTHLTRLRAVLSPTGAQLRWRSIGYCLDADRDAGDVPLFDPP